MESFNQKKSPIEITGNSLTIEEIVSVARFGRKVKLSNDEVILSKVMDSEKYVEECIESGQDIYGITTSFGGLSHIRISKNELCDLQMNLLHFLKAGAGNKISVEDVRAGMLLRANSLLKGVSGIRIKFIQRLLDFLNERITPLVYEFGSIGASGDLVPLAYVAGCLVGVDPTFKVEYQSKERYAIAVLTELNMPSMPLNPKEGLALVNGTSMMTGIAANCIYDAKNIFQLSLMVNAFLLQGLEASNQPFHSFIHECKPHPGQVSIAASIRDLLANSRLIQDEMSCLLRKNENELIQDRYSIRCLAQYLGPILDGLTQINQQIVVEANSATDNPLIDSVNKMSFHCGNFLGQYIGVGMDQLRYFLSLLIKQVDAQIALTVAPEFNRGLSPSLIGNIERPINAGLKGLQICANSIMPAILFYGTPVADKYPTYAEQYNQNINSQGYLSANLSRQVIDITFQYLAISLLFCIQVVDLRTYKLYGHYHAEECLSEKTKQLYRTIKDLLGKKSNRDRPYLWNDHEQSLDLDISTLSKDLKSFGMIPRLLSGIF